MNELVSECYINITGMTNKASTVTVLEQTYMIRNKQVLHIISALSSVKKSNEMPRL